ncbi:hypothetical protein V8F20_011878 [Naviculisporaceae sp. PSN 640]
MCSFTLRDVLPLTFSLIGGLSAPVSAAPFNQVQAGSDAFPNKQYNCGEVNIIFTGLPASHPILTSQGLDPALINASIRANTDEILRLGYNIRAVLMGPEVPISHLIDQIHAPDSQGREIPWTGTGVGFGVRGSNREDVTIRFGEIIQTYRDQVPSAPTVFDYDPNSASWAIQSRFPFVGGDCSTTPGKDLGFDVYCDIC